MKNNYNCFTLILIIYIIQISFSIRLSSHKNEVIDKPSLRYIIEILKDPSIKSDLAPPDQQYMKPFKDNYAFTYLSPYNQSLINVTENIKDLSFNKPIAYYDDFYNKLSVKGKILLINPNENDNKHFLYLYAISNSNTFSLYTTPFYDLSPVPFKLFRKSTIKVNDIPSTPCFYIYLPKEINEGSTLLCSMNVSDKELWLKTLI